MDVVHLPTQPICRIQSLLKKPATQAPNLQVRAPNTTQPGPHAGPTRSAPTGKAWASTIRIAASLQKDGTRALGCTHGQRTFREERAIPPMKVSGGSLDLIRPVKQSKLVQVGLFQQHCISPSIVLSLAVTGARNEAWQAVGELLADSTEAQTITRAGKRWTQSRSKVPVVDCLFQWAIATTLRIFIGICVKNAGISLSFWDDLEENRKGN